MASRIVELTQDMHTINNGINTFLSINGNLTNYMRLLQQNKKKIVASPLNKLQKKEKR